MKKFFALTILSILISVVSFAQRTISCEKFINEVENVEDNIKLADGFVNDMVNVISFTNIEKKVLPNHIFYNCQFGKGHKVNLIVDDYGIMVALTKANVEVYDEEFYKAIVDLYNCTEVLKLRMIGQNDSNISIGVKLI